MQVGVGALTFQEMRAHFALWALLKSPLMLGADLSTLSVDQLKLVSNREIIAVNQDELGVPGDQVWKEGPYEVCILPTSTGTDVESCSFGRRERPLQNALSTENRKLARHSANHLWRASRISARLLA